MKVVFISGPYRASSWEGIEQNIQRAKQAAIKIWQSGDCAICPHMNTAHFDGLADDKMWLDGCLEIMSRCDEVFMLKGWEKSEGSLVEHKLALKFGKVIRYESTNIENQSQF